MSQPPPGATTPVLVLPRPNPGPEPWAPTNSGGPPWAVVLVALALLALAGVLLLWSRRRRAARRQGADSPVTPELAASVAPEARDLLATAAEARRRLAAALGPSWLARTTEETAASAVVRTRLGEADHRRLTDLLGAADRAKFAGAAPCPEPPDGAAALLERLGALSAGEESANGAPGAGPSAH